MRRGTTVFFGFLTFGVIVWFADSALEGKFSKNRAIQGATNQQTNQGPITVRVDGIPATFEK